MVAPAPRDLRDTNVVLECWLRTSQSDVFNIDSDELRDRIRLLPRIRRGQHCRVLCRTTVQYELNCLVTTLGQKRYDAIFKYLSLLKLEVIGKSIFDSCLI